ncbi:tRNA (adenine(37)-N6)-methyltransferase [Galleria mellonella]|uniref:tRNA (Adenine(37)-N6)-methyltransferase n=1 Tax=Galleria mellonella TaxID=7137 RepID=A0A6J1WF52_GALME|nr:tRNA (adenine(37)-N6)-methyltransferase [Galleria mellonella]
MTENIDYYRNQITLARTEIKNLRQQLSALKHEHLKEIKLIKTALNGLRCANCADSATSVVSNHSDDGPSSSEDSENILYRPIGVIETSFQNKRGVPRQPSVLAKARGTVIINQNVFNNPEHALSGLEEFSHIWIIFHFHATESSNVPAKVAPPRLGGERRGVFSTRSPHRPCPIGLSLVKIQSVEGNKIHFLGVDMVNGTPVLDIKPYIPQYDYPSSYGDSMSSLVRPPTEGISDAADTLANLQLDDDNFDNRSLSPRITNPIGVDTSSPLPRSPYQDDIPSPGDRQSSFLTPISPSPDSPSSIDMLDGNFRRSPERLDAERGAPDGQERFTPPQSAHLSNISHDGIRVAPWISNPPSQPYEVRFTDDALERLTELIGDRADAFKSNIECLLSEDPRSHYVRTRYPDHEYNCVLEDLSISCVFDVSSSICTIIAVRSAEDLQ